LQNYACYDDHFDNEHNKIATWQTNTALRSLEALRFKKFIVKICERSEAEIEVVLLQLPVKSTGFKVDFSRNKIYHK